MIRAWASASRSYTKTPILRKKGRNEPLEFDDGLIFILWRFAAAYVRMLRRGLRC